MVMDLVRGVVALGCVAGIVLVLLFAVVMVTNAILGTHDSQRP